MWHPLALVTSAILLGIEWTNFVVKSEPISSHSSLRKLTSSLAFLGGVGLARTLDAK